MMIESSKRHSKFLSFIFILKCLSKASVIRTGILQKKLCGLLEETSASPPKNNPGSAPANEDRKQFPFNPPYIDQ